MIELLYHLIWRHNILTEEVQGLKSCVISLHNLVHLPDDIQHFSAPDNYWCYSFERAVRTYVERSSKNLEMTFAKAESRKELLKFLLSEPSLSIAPSQLAQCEHTGSPQGCLQQVIKKRDQYSMLGIYYNINHNWLIIVACALL